MSRVAKSPIQVPSGIDVSIDGQKVDVKGPKGNLHHEIHEAVEINRDGEVLTFKPNNDSRSAMALAGTTRSLINNMVIGVSQGYEKKLELVGVGYRAQVQGSKLSLSLGFSHPVDYVVRDGISVETPSQTEVIVRGVDKQKVGQVAAEIRAYRPPEPYKGKGVRYAGEHIVRKEAKKK
ncbi:MAG: 50S ribosomal protein L6 [Gammaproteobacteria bacterium]|nr:50S ribosomal protein L6 [Gammaproteobacteria bacterium]